jgi:hypothetical protein
MPVQKGFERIPKTGGSQFGFSSATGHGAHRDTVSGGGNFITLKKGQPSSLRDNSDSSRHTHRTIFHE